MKKMLFILFFILICAQANAANINSSVNRDTIPQGEVFVLTITSDENTNKKPDLSVLNDNFDTYSTSVSRSSYIVNGKASSSTKWQVTLSAKQTGKQKIPSVQVGDDFSNEVSIEVLPYGEKSTDRKKTATPEYSMRTEIANKYNTFYVQQQIPYYVTITDIGGLQGGEPVFETNDNFIIKSLGQPDVSSKYVNGQNIREITFKYVLFALKSGKMTIPPVRFNGYTISSNGAGIFGDGILNINIGLPSRLGFEVPISLFAPEREVNILPAPADYKGKWWLPADSVEIRANFTDNNKNFMVGEAFSREIIVTAVGVTDTQLPAPDFALNSDFKQYPQKSTATNDVVENMPVATQKTTNVYIPERSGELTLPEVSVEWFDVNSKKVRVAKVPEQTIRVKENPNLKMEVITENKSGQETNSARSDSVNMVQLIILVFGAFFVGLLVSYFIFKPRQNKRKKVKSQPKTYPNLITKKAKENDFKGLRDALISWASNFYSQKQISTLTDVANAADDKDFAEQIDVIVSKLYNPQSNCTFDADAFITSFNKLSKKNVKQKNAPPLPTLYE